MKTTTPTKKLLLLIHTAGTLAFYSNFLVGNKLKTLLIFLTLSQITISCEEPLKDITVQPNNSEEDKISVGEAEEFFMKNLDDTKFRNDIIRVPIWAHSENVTTDSTTVLRVPLIYVGEQTPPDIIYHLLLFKNIRDNSLNSVIEQMIVDSAYLSQNGYSINPETFTGVKIYQDWFRGPMFGYTYEQGQITGSIVDIQETSPNGRTQSTMSSCEVL